MPHLAQLNRIEKVLDYIHANLDKSISVPDLAEKSCWSRWQFQRVFHEATGGSVAQYIREIRLSLAAEQLLDSKKRHLDIALECGFDSEISFSRSFKKMFGCSPRKYRTKGARYGLKTPIKYKTPITPQWMERHTYPQIRIETKEAFTLFGINRPIDGLFSKQPDFNYMVPKIWQQFWEKFTYQQQPIIQKETIYGVIDTRQYYESQDPLNYWAGLPKSALESYKTISRSIDSYSILDIPIQEYAVITVKGEVSQLEYAVKWFILHWLPESNYRSVAGFELEVYPPNYDPMSQDGYMEYWLPVQYK